MSASAIQCGDGLAAAFHPVPAKSARAKGERTFGATRAADLWLRGVIWNGDGEDGWEC